MTEPRASGIKPAAWPAPTWQVPTPYGYARAVDTASSVAAPLLAGFSVTLIVLVIDQAAKIRWPSLALMMLTSATILLLVAIQAAFAARQYVVAPEEIESWWPDINEPERWTRQRAVQFGHAKLLGIWLRRFRATYNAGILFFLLALPIVLVPPRQVNAKHVHIASSRIAAIIIAVFGVVVELAWMLANALSVRYGRTRWLEQQPLDARVLSRLVLAIVPATEEVTPPDLASGRWPSWFTSEEQQRCERSYSTADSIEGNTRRRPTWSDAGAEAVIMLSVLGLMTAAAFVGWIIGRFG